MRMRLRSAALSDIREIREDGLDRWGAARTRDFLDGLFTAIERLAEFPLMGRSRADIHVDLRSISHRGYVVFYLANEDRPTIMAVLHERRNHAAFDFADRLDDG